MNILCLGFISMKTSDFDYELPQELIAQTPVEPRDHSRLMVLSRQDGSIQHRRFSEIVAFLRPGDVLVFNDSRVIPARLYGHKEDSGGKVEILLLRRIEPGVWETLVRHGNRLKTGTTIEITKNSLSGERQNSSVTAEAIGARNGGIKVLRFSIITEDSTFLLLSTGSITIKGSLKIL